MALAVAGCATLFPDNLPKRTADETRQERDELQAAYARARASGTRADEQAFTAKVRSFAAYAFDKDKPYYKATPDDIALANEFIDKVAAMLEARSAATPGKGELLLEEAELLGYAKRWDATIAVVRRALAIPGCSRGTAYSRWYEVGERQKRPDIILDACRTIGPMGDYDFHISFMCVRDGANGDVQRGLAWASEEDRARYRADKAAFDAGSRKLEQQNQKDEDRKAARTECRNACVEDYQYCVGRSSSPNYSDCLDERAACFEKCEHVTHFERRRF